MSESPKPEPRSTQESSFFFVYQNAATFTDSKKDPELMRVKQRHVQRRMHVRRMRSDQSSSEVLSPSESLPTSRTLDPDSTMAEASGGYFKFRALTLPLPGAALSKIPATDVATRASVAELSELGPLYFASQLPLRPQGTSFLPIYSSSPELYSTSSPADALALRPLGGSFSPKELDAFIVGKNIILEQWAPRLIQYFTHTVIPQVFFNDSLAAPLAHLRVAQGIHVDLQACMSDPAHLYSLLAAASALMLREEGRLSLGNAEALDQHKVPTLFETRAIEALQSKIANGQLDHQVAADVMRLTLVSTILGEPDAAATHFRALRSIIDTLGGSQNLDDYLVERLATVDWLRALRNLTGPELDLTWDPGALPPSIEEEVDQVLMINPQYAHLGEYLESLVGSKELANFALLDISSHLSQATRMALFLEQLDEYRPEYFRWLSLRFASLANQLLRFDDFRTQGFEKHECIRIGLLLWIGLSRNPDLATCYSAQQVHMLRQALAWRQPDLDSLWYPHSRFLLWLCIVARCSSNSDEDKTWFDQLAEGIARVLQVETSEELERLMAGVFHVPQFLRPILIQSFESLSSAF